MLGILLILAKIENLLLQPLKKTSGHLFFLQNHIRKDEDL